MRLNSPVFRIDFKEAMNGLGFPPRRFGKTLRRAPRWGAKLNPYVLGFQDREKRLHERCFAYAGSPGDDAELRLQCRRNRGALTVGQSNAELRFDPGYGLLGIDRGPWQASAPETAHFLGDALFREIETDRIDAPRFREHVFDDSLRFEFEVDRRLNHVFRNVEKFHRLLDEFRAWKTAVPGVPRRFEERIGNPGAGTKRGMPVDPDVLRNGIGRLETDPADVLRKAIRILLNDPDGVVAVSLVDAHGL